MSRNQRIRSKSGYYHIMLSGNERKNIFNCDDDKLRFLEIIHDKKQDNSFYIQAFCLMDNHLHLMISEGSEDIARVMKRITVSYVQYFNRKYKRTGHLFQDRFKSEVVEQEGYVLALVRYIHQNPVKAGFVNNMSDYKWSSYNCYLDSKNNFSKLLDTDLILGLFSNDHKIAVNKYIEYMNESSDSSFIDMAEAKEEMDEAEAGELFEKLLGERLSTGGEIKNGITDELIKEFREKTGLSIRRIASITGLNKDRINRILRQ